jgi:hypothetical protein
MGRENVSSKICRKLVENARPQMIVSGFPLVIILLLGSTYYIRYLPVRMIYLDVYCVPRIYLISHYYQKMF